MISIDKIDNAEVFDVFSRYPEDIRKRLMFLRQLIIEVATESEDIDNLEECLKWVNLLIWQKQEVQ